MDITDPHVFQDFPRANDVLVLGEKDLALRLLFSLRGDSLNRGNSLNEVGNQYGNSPAVAKAFLGAWAYLQRQGYLVEKSEPGWFFVSEAGEEEKTRVRSAGGFSRPTPKRKVAERWVVERELSSGGQGVTSLIRDVKGPRDELFVLKELRNADDLQARKRFDAEIKALSMINHPNILKVVDVNVTETPPWYVSEFCSGRGLDKALLAEMDLELRMELFLDVCRGLAAAHEKGITHRDIKPENVLLKSERGPAVLGDFGICWFLESDEGRLTRAHEDIGSSFCRAPELFDGPLDKVAPSSDVYCLRKLLYWMILGKGGRSGRLHREEFERADKNLASLFDDQKFEHVNSLLRKMVTENSGERFKDAGEVLEAASNSFELFESDFQPINKPPNECDYCGQGAYTKRGSGHGTATELSILHGWHIYECKTCGHTLFVRKNERNNKW